MRLAYQGVSATAGYLTVFFDVRLGRAAHPHEIRVPIEDLLSGQVLEQLDRAHRRALIASWSGEPLDVPLF